MDLFWSVVTEAKSVLNFGTVMIDLKRSGHDHLFILLRLCISCKM